MYIICFYCEVTKSNVWERIAGEDAMHDRVNELCESGLSSEDILVFPESSEIDSLETQDNLLQANDDIGKICEILDVSLARAGYKILDGGADGVIIRSSQEDRDYEVKIVELF